MVTIIQTACLGKISLTTKENFMSQSGPLRKARLQSKEGGTHIEFMFNPNELNFSRSLELTPIKGARTKKGMPKISFGYPQPYSLTINNILFDTYETGENVLVKYIDPFREAVSFDSFKLSDDQRDPKDKERPKITKRPSTYLFTWGGEEYLLCLVKTLSYKLTLFLPNGTPVRAIVNLTLEEVDESAPEPDVSTPEVSKRLRQQEQAKRKGAKKSVPNK
jgi:hypothetical protein